jgi:hypothetical protein
VSRPDRGEGEREVIYHVTIHQPKPGAEGALVDSMHRFGEVARGQAGLREAHTLRDQRTGALVGLAVWDSSEALAAARPALAAATAGDDFDAWEAEPVRVYLLEEV